MRHILIKYASRGRSDWFKKAILNIQATISDSINYTILVSADEDDPEMNNQSIRNFCNVLPNIILVFGTSTDKISAINRDMDLPIAWDILVNMSDDMSFIVMGWDNIMRQRIKDVWGYEITDFFAHFNDGYTRDLLPTMSIMGRHYYCRDGYIYHPSYKSFSCDAEAMFVAMMRGKYYYFPEILFLHQHPNNTPVKNDLTYHINSLHTPHDTKNYFERLKNYFYEPSGHEVLKAREDLKQYL
jgi:hypothetical protein